MMQLARNPWDDSRARGRFVTCHLEPQRRREVLLFKLAARDLVHSSWQQELLCHLEVAVTVSLAETRDSLILYSIRTEMTCLLAVRKNQTLLRVFGWKKWGEQTRVSSFVSLVFYKNWRQPRMQLGYAVWGFAVGPSCIIQAKADLSFRDLRHQRPCPSVVTRERKMKKECLQWFFLLFLTYNQENQETNQEKAAHSATPWRIEKNDHSEIHKTVKNVTSEKDLKKRSWKSLEFFKRGIIGTAFDDWALTLLQSRLATVETRKTVDCFACLLTVSPAWLFRLFRLLATGLRSGFKNLRKRKVTKKKKKKFDRDVIRTRNLLIWSQTRYRCATKSIVKLLSIGCF